AADSTQRAQSFIRGYRDLLLVKDPDNELEVSRVSDGGPSHVVLRQRYGGLPVCGAEIVVTMSGDEVLALTGSLLPTEILDAANLNLTPTLTAEQALDSALTKLQAELPADQPDVTAS